MLSLPTPSTDAGEDDVVPLLRDPADPADPADPTDPDAPDLRPYLIGGAITSAALSLAGAVWVAWRRTRPPARSPMRRAARAARAARQARLARRAG
jgi:hypothetical protein